MGNHIEEVTPKQPSGRRTLRGRKRKIEIVIENEPQFEQELSWDDLPIVEILQKMNIGSFKRKKVGKEIEVLPQTKILPQKENPKAKEKKTRGFPTTGLRRITRLNTMKESVYGVVEHINLELKEQYVVLEDSERESLKLSPRVSPPPFSSPLRSLV